MTIIKDNTAKEYTCAHCESILSVSQHDLKFFNGTYKGTYKVGHYFECPCCEMINFV